MPQKNVECFRLLFDYLAWIEHQILSGIRDSRKTGSLWRMMRGVAGVKKSIYQSWLAKGLGLLCWGFKVVQQEIPWEEASTLQIGSMAIPPEQYTSPQLHPCHRLFDLECILIGISAMRWLVLYGFSDGSARYHLLDVFYWVRMLSF